MTNTVLETTDVAQLDAELNEMILDGKAMDAFDQFYADDIVMQENTGEEYRGKEFNRKREEDFFAGVEAMHDNTLRASAVNGNITFSEWDWDLTLKGVGRIRMVQVAVRRWEDGKVAHERFYHA